MFILVCVILSVIIAFSYFNKTRETYESIIVVIIMAVIVGGLGGTGIGVFGDAGISKFLEVNEKISITEPKIVILKMPSGLDRYVAWDNEKEQWKDIGGVNIILAEEGRKELVLREITKTVGYKNPVNNFLFNYRKSVGITKEIILPKRFNVAE